jgi:hypothetical protein
MKVMARPTPLAGDFHVNPVKKIKSQNNMSWGMFVNNILATDWN